MQRLIGGGRWPALRFLQEHGGVFAGDLVQLDVELSELCARNYEGTTPRQGQMGICGA